MQETGHCRDRTSPSALRLEARQERLGIIANPVQVNLPVAPPRDVWTRWPKLRSARRRETLREHASERRLAGDPVLNGQKLEAFTSELRSKADRLETPPATNPPHKARPRLATDLTRLMGRAARLPAYTMPAFHVMLIRAAGMLAWALRGGR